MFTASEDLSNEKLRLRQKKLGRVSTSPHSSKDNIRMNEYDIGEVIYGNVNMVCPSVNIRDKPLKRGELIFNANFESGNLGRVDYINECEYDLFIRPDNLNPRFRVWYYFSVQNVRSNQKVIFNIVNFSKTRALFREGMTPVVRSTSRVKWQRIPNKYVFYYRCPDHNRNYVLSFVFAFDREVDIYYFAYCYPYSCFKLHSFTDSLLRKKMKYFSKKILCYSAQHRPVEILTISHPNNLKDGIRKRVIFITARVHPGETPASYVCQGFIDFLVTYHPVANALRRHLVFKIVPILNPDGVALGNYRTSATGVDLNRCWQDPTTWSHPVIYTCKSLLMEYDDRVDVDLDFFIDIHGHSTLLNAFMYGNTYDDPVRCEEQEIFPRLFCCNAEDFSMANTSYNRDSIKAGTGRRSITMSLKQHSLCYTLEVSFFGYQLGNSSISIPYSEDTLQRVGYNLARTFFDYYRLAGVIPVNIPQELSVTKSKKYGQKYRSHYKNKDQPKRVQSSVINIKESTHKVQSSSSVDKKKWSVSRSKSQGSTSQKDKSSKN